MGTNYAVKMYAEKLTKKQVLEFIKKACKKTSKTMTSYDANVFEFSPNRFLSLVFEGPGAYFGVKFSEEDGFTFSLAKRNGEYKITMDYALEHNPRKFLNAVEQAYEIFHPYFGAADDTNMPFNPRYKNGKLPKYFEWFWILGPEIAKKYDLTKIPRKFKVKKMKDGGIMITDPKPYDSNITEQDKKQLYNLPKH